MSHTHGTFIHDCQLIAAGAQRAAEAADTDDRPYWLDVAGRWQRLAVFASTFAIIVSQEKIAA